MGNEFEGYPKMIYKGGLGNLNDEYCIVKSAEEHKRQLDQWGIKKAKPVEKVVESVENEETPVKADPKPVRKKRAKKKVSKKSTSKKVEE